MRSTVLALVMMVSLGWATGSGHADSSYRLLDDFPELAEFGDTVWIDGIEYWRPHWELIPTDWQPLDNGYPGWVATALVWVSDEPWGYITEHYGIWRHVRPHVTADDEYVNGYVWRPFEPIQWYPFVGTTLRSRDGGLHCYSTFFLEAYRNGYYHNSNAFDDGYWNVWWRWSADIGFIDQYQQRYPRVVYCESPVYGEPVWQPPVICPYPIWEPGEYPEIEPIYEYKEEMDVTLEVKKKRPSVPVVDPPGGQTGVAPPVRTPQPPPVAYRPQPVEQPRLGVAPDIEARPDRQGQPNVQPPRPPRRQPPKQTPYVAPPKQDRRADPKPAPPPARDPKPVVRPAPEVKPAPVVRPAPTPPPRATPPKAKERPTRSESQKRNKGS